MDCRPSPGAARQLDDEYIPNIIEKMATTVHIPAEILRRVDSRAKGLNLSRNRFIVQTLAKALDDNSTWSPEFLKLLCHVAPIDSEGSFLKGIISNRRSKKAPPDL